MPVDLYGLYHINITTTIRKKMRFILFYSGIESFNHFTDQIDKELKQMGHETFILDLRDAKGAVNHSLTGLTEFMHCHVDAAIGYEQMPVTGHAFVELWDEADIPVISIFMDPPFRFGNYNRDLPKNYLRFCCDSEHISFCRRFYSSSIPNVHFLPHAATVPTDAVPSFNEKKYDLLFSGTYYSPDGYLSTIKEKYSDNLRNLLYEAIDFMKSYPEHSFPTAVDRILSLGGYNADEKTRLLVMESGEEADWYIRMYYREKVVDSILDSGRDLWLLGRGWENHKKAGFKNMHILSDRVSFRESLRFMADSRINLNVMPWFKDGTHDRIFNTLLRDSLPLTDSSLYLKDHFTDHSSIEFYDLYHIDKLPSIIEALLKHPDNTQRIIKAGKQIVIEKFTWKNIVYELIEASKAFA